MYLTIQQVYTVLVDSFDSNIDDDLIRAVLKEAAEKEFTPADLERFIKNCDAVIEGLAEEEKK